MTIQISLLIMDIYFQNTKSIKKREEYTLHLKKKKTCTKLNLDNLKLRIQKEYMKVKNIYIM